MSDEAILLGVGDILIDRAEPETMFRHVAPLLRSGDVTFGNCEQMYSDMTTCPSPIHSTHSTPENIEALTFAGFNVISMANNHTMDWGGDALLDTLSRLRGRGIAPVGAGANLQEARRPVIVERKGVSVGFLAYGCVGPESYQATENGPGYAPVHVWTVYQETDYGPATPRLIRSFSRQEQLQAMMDDIRRLKETCDVVVISFHWGVHYVPRLIPDYCFEVGHAAVDAGADLVIGTQPHILKGVEMYRGKAIFYSTGNFALEIGPGAAAGENIPELVERWRELYRYDPDPDYPTYPMHPEAKTTMVVKATLSPEGIEKVGYIPCYINPAAEPEIVGASDPRGVEVFEYVKSISLSEGLKANFEWEGDEVVITD